MWVNCKGLEVLSQNNSFSNQFDAPLHICTYGAVLTTRTVSGLLCQHPAINCKTEHLSIVNTIVCEEELVSKLQETIKGPFHYFQ
jgi:hypothetical protein